MGLYFKFHPVGSFSRNREPGFYNQEVALKNLVAKFLADRSGATAIEYGLIAAGIALAIITAVNGLGTNLNAKFTSINSSIN